MHITVTLNSCIYYNDILANKFTWASGGPGPTPANTLNHEQVVQRPKVREIVSTSVVAGQL